MRQIESEAGLRHAIDGVVPPTRLVVKVSGPGEAVQSVNEDESYSLVVTAAGAEIDAATVVGAMQGLETLVQLVQPTSGRLRAARGHDSGFAAVSLGAV